MPFRGFRSALISWPSLSAGLPLLIGQRRTQAKPLKLPGPMLVGPFWAKLRLISARFRPIPGPLGRPLRRQGGPGQRRPGRVWHPPCRRPRALDYQAARERASAALSSRPIGGPPSKPRAPFLRPFCPPSGPFHPCRIDREGRNERSKSAWRGALRRGCEGAGRAPVAGGSPCPAPARAPRLSPISRVEISAPSLPATRRALAPKKG
jgi:hypothetical protein